MFECSPVSCQRFAGSATCSCDVKMRPLHTVLDEALDERGRRICSAGTGTHVLDVAFLYKKEQIPIQSKIRLFDQVDTYNKLK